MFDIDILYHNTLYILKDNITPMKARTVTSYVKYNVIYSYVGLEF